MTTWADLFTDRQLLSLTTHADLVQEVRERVKRDAMSSGLSADGAAAYANAVALYLGLGISKTADYNSALVVWSPTRDQAKSTFARQALPMVWDFAEVNPLAEAAGDVSVSLDGMARVLSQLGTGVPGSSEQADAQSQLISKGKVVSTDPPYYDNVGYADLSDFFYVWLRRALRPVFPALFATVAVPKAEELVATPDRHGGRDKAAAFFLDGMTQAVHHLAEQAHPAFPVTIYYAFKQAENDDENATASTGWETCLDAVIRAGFATTGTWPMRTEREA